MLSLSDQGRAFSSDLELPSYYATTRVSSIPRGQAQHLYHSIKRGKPWLTLEVASRATSAERTPTFVQGQTISGSVKLSLDREVVIRSISVAVTGELSSGTDSSRFLTIIRELFSSEQNDSTVPFSTSPSRAGRLSSTHTWPFSIKLPKGIIIDLPRAGNTHTRFRLPPSFSDHRSKEAIQYHLLVRVKKGTLSAGHKIVIPFDYIPLARPAPPSLPRQIAHLESSPVPGPGRDPGGWRILEPIKLPGKIFNARPVEATCILSIAKPLCYTRGTRIPLALTITSQDSQALDLLSVPLSPSVHLVRRAWFSGSISLESESVLSNWNIHRDDIATAVWLPAVEDLRREDIRTLHGEIDIPGDIPPNCHILNYRLQYVVVVDPFRAVGFVPSVSSKEPLIYESIDIVTVHAQGFRAIAQSPPSYT